MRLAWFSPLPPSTSGIADYSLELLPLVAERAEVDVYPSPALLHRRPRIGARFRVCSPRRFGARAERYDAVLYHLGNNPAHAFVYRTALLHPGVVAFHDFTLHHLISYLTVLPGDDWPEYERLLVEEHGEAARRLADLRFRNIATDLEKFLFPMNRHVARRARAIVAHSADVRDRILEVAPEVPVTMIPHHAGSPPREVVGIDRGRARRMLGLPADGFLVGQFGYVTAPKQPAAVVRGFAHLAAHRPDAKLLIVGADRSGGGLARLIHRAGVAGRVRLTGFVDLTRFYLHLKAVDAVVNLRYPSAGEASGTFARSLSEGRATIVNNLGAFAEVPSDVALRVEVDGDQAAEVGAHLVRLADDAQFRLAIERRAREYARTALDPGRCAELYLRAARLSASR